MQAREVYAHETDAYEIHAREIHAHETPAHQMHARGMHAHEVQINHKRPHMQPPQPPQVGLLASILATTAMSDSSKVSTSEQPQFRRLR